MNDLFSTEFLQELGIVKWGYTEDPIPKSLENYNQWVERGDHGALGYLADERRLKRQSLKEYDQNFQSALVFLFDYSGIKKQIEASEKRPNYNGFKIASYVLGFDGQDYHHVLRDRLNKISEKLSALSGEIEFRFSLDTQPVLERDLAYRAGLGWFGKNSMLINQKHGSFFIVGSLLLNKKLAVETSPLEIDHCGNCTACLDACPTDAFDIENRTIIADKCISTWTIELFKEGAPAPNGMENSGGEIFGCDICQDVCPWNKPENAPILGTGDNFDKIINFFTQRPRAEVIEELQSMSNKGFEKKFKGTPLQRTGRRGLLKNIKFYSR